MAQERRIPGRGSDITFEAEGETVNAYLARPVGRGPHPGIVIILEWWGLNDQIKGVVDRFAGIGYLALAPDLYRGKVARDAGLAHDLSRGLSETRAVGIVKGAVAHLRSLEGARDRPVATLGFCMGGRISLASALKGADVQATVIFYGSVETTPEALAPIRAPVLGIFGREDRGIPVADVERFEAALKTAGKDATIIIYRGAGHAFFNEERSSYDMEVAQDAWHRTREFLDKYLKPAPAAPG
jgi:carboxymethylenebutenolidase